MLLPPSKKIIEVLFDNFLNFAGGKDILYDETKTQCIAFCPRLYTQSVLLLVALGTVSLKFIDEMVYLGHSIRSKLKDDSDV